LNRITVTLVVVTAFFLGACESKQEAAPESKETAPKAEATKKPAEPPKTAKAVAKDAPKAGSAKPVAAKTVAAKPVAAKTAAAVKTEAKDGEIVFDPRTPPAGYVRCHRNHCHKVGGGVASYQQIMAEIGATKLVGVPKQAPMPKAPADVASPPADAEKTASGLASKVLSAGSESNRPGPTSVVTVHYSGWTTDGKAFDSSVSRGRPATFPLNRVIPGWTEGLQLMNVGEERRFWIPEAIAYGGQPGKPAGMLVFDVELLGIR
jgi:hypothetical protein